MAQQQQKELTHLQSCKRLQALSAYRQSQNDLFEALSVLNDALFYLNPSHFSDSGSSFSQANKMRTEVQTKQEELRLKLKKPLISVEGLKESIKQSSKDNQKIGAEHKVSGLKRKMNNESVGQNPSKENILID